MIVSCDLSPICWFDHPPIPCDECFTMTQSGYTTLPDRAILEIEGEDSARFLQGLITIDSEKIKIKTASYGCLLTPQGKYAYDFFLYRKDSNLFWLETDAARAPDLMKRLRLFKLRSKVVLTLLDPAPTIIAVPGIAVPITEENQSWDSFTDPRHSALGLRIITSDADNTCYMLEQAGLSKLPITAYEQLRLKLGIPDGARDMEIDKSTMLECNIDQLGGVDWAKGCYMGQELTARTRYRGLVKKRLVPLIISGPLPDYGTAVELDGKIFGETRSASGDQALALMKLTGIGMALNNAAEFTVGEAQARLALPEWLRIEPEEI